MKYSIILLIAVIFTVSYADEWTPEYFKNLDVEDECIEESKRFVELDLTKKEMSQKYVLCYVKKTGLFDENRGYIVDRLEALAEKENKGELDKIKGCLDNNEQKSSVEEWAYRGFKCFKESERAV